MTTNRQRGVLVSMIDGDKLLELVNRERAQRAKDNGYTGSLDPAQVEEQGVLETPKGWVSINTEGVGVFPSAGDRVVVWYATSWSWDHVELPLNVVRMASTGEQRDLADLIRVFGDRLERNFSIWHHQATGAFADAI